MKSAPNKKNNRNHKRSKDWWDELSAEAQASIDRGLAELKAGKGIPHEEVVKQYAKWFIR